MTIEDKMGFGRSCILVLAQPIDDDTGDDDSDVVGANLYSSPSVFQVHVKLFPATCCLTQSLQQPFKS